MSSNIVRHITASTVAGCFIITLLTSCTITAPTEDRTTIPESDIEAMQHLDPMEPTYTPNVSNIQDKPESDKEVSSDVQKRVEAIKTETTEIEQRIIDGDASAKICYLTFDDGPSDNTLDILNILEEKGVFATFFVKGNSDQIELVKDIANKGHSIGLHTYTHDYAQLYASDDAYFVDLAAVQDAVSTRIGHTVDIVRFPGGTSNTVSADYSIGIMSRLTQSVLANGYQYFDWNLSGGDSSSPPPPAANIENNVLLNTGSMQRVCVLMHDTTVKRTTVEALPSIIDGLREQGYTFGVLEHDTPPFHHGANN